MGENSIWRLFHLLLANNSRICTFQICGKRNNKFDDDINSVHWMICMQPLLGPLIRSKPLENGPLIDSIKKLETDRIHKWAI